MLVDILWSASPLSSAPLFFCYLVGFDIKPKIPASSLGLPSWYKPETQFVTGNHVIAIPHKPHSRSLDLVRLLRSLPYYLCGVITHLDFASVACPTQQSKVRPAPTHPTKPPEQAALCPTPPYHLNPIPLSSPQAAEHHRLYHSQAKLSHSMITRLASTSTLNISPIHKNTTPPKSQPA